MKETIRRKLYDSGAVAVGFAKAGMLPSRIYEDYLCWIGEKRHAGMDYLERHVSLKKNTENVLKGAKTVISLAFDYTPLKWREEKEVEIAAYAYGEDYHNVLKKNLRPVIKDFRKAYGGEWRVCVDSAPVSERFWAMESGIGRRGSNGSIIIDKIGSFCFLTEILTTLRIEPDIPSREVCMECGKCMEICPGKAIKGDGTIDAEKCINYLTIEKKGDFTEKEKELVRSENGHLYGCDRCLKVCPHNCIGKTEIPVSFKINQYDRLVNTGNFSEKLKDIQSNRQLFSPLENIMTLTAEKILAMEEAEFNEIFKNSPLSYAGYTRLKRNALALLK